MRRVILLALGCCFLNLPFSSAQLPEGEKEKFTHADTLRGTITPERAWWNVLRYTIDVTPNFNTETIEGSNEITFEVLKAGKKMQIDLQAPMFIDSIYLMKYTQVSGPGVREVVRTQKTKLSFGHNGNVWYVRIPAVAVRSEQNVRIYYHGKPRKAVRPPWDGGWIWTKDKLGRPWMSVACQGLGASVWYPCKDHQSDEPDDGASLHITVPDTLVAVGNGRLKEKKDNGNRTTTYSWSVVNPINNYDIIPYIGKYVNFHEDFQGEKGHLDCNYWVLDYNLEIAKEQFKQADSMLRCFEYWMGPYPFYEDGYKLVEAPHLGMEHQSAVAYGNHFANGYLGRDLSGTGWGMKWDFIIVHESGHEWFGNNITTNDLADMWVHEGFTNYSETLYTTCQDGVEAGNDYCIGSRKNIRNDKPVIGAYGVNNEGSGDMYCKGGSLLHMIRQMTGDSSFREMLRGLNATFYHKTVTSQQIENYINEYTKKDLLKVFTQYLRTTMIPALEYKFNSSSMLSYRWTNCVAGFNLPVKVSVAGQPEQWIEPTPEWKTLNFGSAGAVVDSAKVAAAADSAKAAGADSTKIAAADSSRAVAPAATKDLSVDRNFYVTVKKLN